MGNTAEYTEQIRNIRRIRTNKRTPRHSAQEEAPRGAAVLYSVIHTRPRHSAHPPLLGVCSSLPCQRPGGSGTSVQPPASTMSELLAGAFAIFLLPVAAVAVSACATGKPQASGPAEGEKQL